MGVPTDRFQASRRTDPVLVGAAIRPKGRNSARGARFAVDHPPGRGAALGAHHRDRVEIAVFQPLFRPDLHRAAGVAAEPLLLIREDPELGEDRPAGPAAPETAYPEWPREAQQGRAVVDVGLVVGKSGMPQHDRAEVARILDAAVVVAGDVLQDAAIVDLAVLGLVLVEHADTVEEDEIALRRADRRSWPGGCGCHRGASAKKAARPSLRGSSGLVVPIPGWRMPPATSGFVRTTRGVVKRSGPASGVALQTPNRSVASRGPCVACLPHLGTRSRVLISPAGNLLFPCRSLCWCHESLTARPPREQQSLHCSIGTGGPVCPTSVAVASMMQPKITRRDRELRQALHHRPTRRTIYTEAHSRKLLSACLPMKSSSEYAETNTELCRF